MRSASVKDEEFQDIIETTAADSKLKFQETHTKVDVKH